MQYKKRKPDGTFGETVETPGHQAPLAPEILAALEAVAMLDMQNAEMAGTIQEQQQLLADQRKEIKAMKAEIAALKGGEGA